jgi:hypothetical protein
VTETKTPENPELKQVGRAGIEPATHEFSVPDKPRFSPRKGRFDDMVIPLGAWKNKGRLCRDTGANAPCVSAREKTAEPRAIGIGSWQLELTDASQTT